MAEIIELDNTTTMSVEGAIARASRENFKSVMIIGVDQDEENVYIFSDTTNHEAHFRVAKAADFLLTGGFVEYE